MTRRLVTILLAAGLLSLGPGGTDPAPAPLPALERGDVILVTILRNDKPIGTARLVWGGSWAPLPGAPPVQPGPPVPPPDKPGSGNPVIHQ